jgi:hypothetical protein
MKASANDRSNSESLPLRSGQIADRVAVSKQKITAPIDRAKSGQKVHLKLNDRGLNNLLVDRLANPQTTKQDPAIAGSKKSLIILDFESKCLEMD